jgi:hypothetical protein
MNIRSNVISNLWTVGLFFLTSLHLQGQSQVIEKITEKLYLFNQRYPEETVYMQTDRTKYSPGEAIWFIAHVLEDRSMNQPNARSKNLYVALVDQDGQEVAFDKFIIENNQVKDNITLPKMLSEGNYMLTAYSSWMVNTPVDRVFSKEIAIEKEDKNKFLVEIKLKDRISISNNELAATIKFTRSDNSPVAAKFNYQLDGKDGEIIKGKGRADEDGKAEIKIALSDFNIEKDVKLLVKALFKGSKAEAGILIPTQTNCLEVKFYPEGGRLIYGAESKIAFRAFNTSNQPEDFEGEIFDQQNNPVMKIKSNYKGTGGFLFNPENGQNYYLKIARPGGITKTFDLPSPIYEGLALSFTSKKNYTISLKVTPVNLEAKVYHFIGQSKGKVYWIKSEKIEQTTGIEIPTEEFPMGLTQFAVFDESLNLLAERSVFINKEKKLNIQIIPNKSVYSPGEKVIAQVKVRDYNDQPVAANLSLSVVNDKFEACCPDNNNFLTYTSLTSHFTGYLPTPSFYFNETEISEEGLDDLAITNESDRFSWHKILNSSDTDSSFKIVDDVVDFNTFKNFDREKDHYMALILSSKLRSPGKSYPVYEKNDLKEIMKKSKASVQKKQTGYSSDQNIFDIIRQIKPYQMVGGKIVLASSGINSINYQSGALIVIDGMPMGTDAQILNTIPVTDIERVNVSNNPVDIQRYTALNNVGIIEIFTKTGGEIQEPSGNSVTENTINSKTFLGRTLYWSPGIQTDNSGRATFSFFNGDHSSGIIITVEGLTNSGLIGSNNIKYSVK